MPVCGIDKMHHISLQENMCDQPLEVILGYLSTILYIQPAQGLCTQHYNRLHIQSRRMIGYAYQEIYGTYKCYK